MLKKSSAKTAEPRMVLWHETDGREGLSSSETMAKERSEIREKAEKPAECADIQKETDKASTKLANFEPQDFYFQIREF